MWRSRARSTLTLREAILADGPSPAVESIQFDIDICDVKKDISNADLHHNVDYRILEEAACKKRRCKRMPIHHAGRATSLCKLLTDHPLRSGQRNKRYPLSFCLVVTLWPPTDGGGVGGGQDYLH